MMVQIHTISFGMSKIYLLKGEKCILVDAGIPGQKKTFLQGLDCADTKPEMIELVIITHGHFDHIGLANFIAETTSAKIAIHKRDREMLETGRSPLLPGTTTWGKLLMNTMDRVMTSVSVRPTKADTVLGDDGLSLDEFGIPGRVIYTPGHTLGSVSVLLEGGEAFVGDLAMSARFMRLKPGPPIFAEDLELVLQSWRKLLEVGARIIYPAHGKPFSIDLIRDHLT